MMTRPSVSENLPPVGDLISVRDIASQHGRRKQTVFKVLGRLGIATTKQQSLLADLAQADGLVAG